MNRAERRRRAALYRKDVTRTVRVHEAGRVMAQLFTSNLLGWTPEEMISHIELGVRHDQIIPHETRPGAVWVVPGVAACMAVSQEMADFLQPRLQAGEDIWTPETFDGIKAAGVDLKPWLFARTIMAVGGMVAESKFTGRPLNELLYDERHSGDWEGMYRDFRLLRRTMLSRSLLSRAIHFLQQAFELPEVWRATLGLADSLRMGRTSGRAACAVVSSHLKVLPCPAFHEMTQVRVRRDWNNERSATYFLEEIEGWHWSDVSGGWHAKAPQKFLHGYVWCNDLIDGELAHSCAHGRGPHRIKVCITRSDNQEAWKEISKEAAWSMQETNRQAA